MSFKEIIGQESAVSFLKAAYRQNRLAGAYVFVGPDGIGKKAVALNFAKLLVCQTPQGQEPCDACSSCLKVGGGNHPDVQVTGPDGQFIKIDSIREACRRLNFKSFESGRQVLLITDAQNLNEESSNALLKTLEEPSPETVIVLITNTLKSILPTIVSRCQRVVFSGLPQELIGSILRDRFGIGSEEALYLSRLAPGSLGAALKHHEEGLFLKKNKMIADAFDKSCPLNEFMELAAKDRSERHETIDETLSVLSAWLRDLFLAKVCPDSQNFINHDRRGDILAASRLYSLADLEERMVFVADTARDLERNINARIALTKLRVELWK